MVLTSLVPIGAGRPLGPGIDGAWDRNKEESVHKFVQVADAGVRPAREGGPLRDLETGKRMPFISVTAPGPVSASTHTAALEPCAATTARPAGPVPRLASAHFFPFADARGQSRRPYQRESLLRRHICSHLAVEGLVFAAAGPASTTTNE